MDVARLLAPVFTAHTVATGRRNCFSSFIFFSSTTAGIPIQYRNVTYIHSSIEWRFGRTGPPIGAARMHVGL